jgi:acid phosphatase family membrane protein YuiD
MQLQPTVRIVLTFLVAALSTLVAMVDDQTIRLIGAPIIAGLAAVGIVPPHIPTRTSVDTENQRVSVVREERGYTIVELLVFTFLGILILIVLLELLDRV